MDNMLGENKNLKDTQKDSVKDTSSVPAQYEAIGFGSVSYTKTNKLITALYMVTDIMEKEEPLRIKLRTLGANIISDIHHMPAQADKGIVAVISFLDIASAINLISEMNSSILKKEFMELKQSIHELKRKDSISEFFLVSPSAEEKVDKGRIQSTGIGIQKGSTLLKALSGIEMSNRISARPIAKSSAPASTRNDFDVLKKQRRDEIIKVVKSYSATGGATITDIRVKASGVLASCGEKTLQRELVSMVKDSVLKKFGEKRWSRYSV